MTRQDQDALYAKFDAVMQRLDQHEKHEDERRAHLEQRIDKVAQRVDAGFADQGERLRKVENAMNQRSGMAKAAGWLVATFIGIATAIGAFITWGLQ